MNSGPDKTDNTVSEIVAIWTSILDTEKALAYYAECHLPWKDTAIFNPELSAEEIFSMACDEFDVK